MSVPCGPTTSSRARTTVSAPPTTWPSALIRQWTIVTPPGPNPSFLRSRASRERATSMPHKVAGAPEMGQRPKIFPHLWCTGEQRDQRGDLVRGIFGFCGALGGRQVVLDPHSQSFGYLLLA